MTDIETKIEVETEEFTEELSDEALDREAAASFRNVCGCIFSRNSGAR